MPNWMRHFQIPSDSVFEFSNWTNVITQYSQGLLVRQSPILSVSDNSISFTAARCSTLSIHLFSILFSHKISCRLVLNSMKCSWRSIGLLEITMILYIETNASPNAGQIPNFGPYIQTRLRGFKMVPPEATSNRAFRKMVILGHFYLQNGTWACTQGTS